MNEDEADCSAFDVGCHVGGLATDVLTTIANAFVEAVTAVAVTVTTFWIGVPTPNISAGAGGQPSDTVAFLQESLGFFTVVLLAVSMAIGLANVAWQYSRGERSEATEKLGKALLKFIAVSGGAVTFIWMALRIGDAFSVWIIDRSVSSGDFGSNLISMLGYASLAGGGGLVVGLVLILAFISIFVGLAQLVIMLARGGLLVIVAGVLPTSASFTTTEAGEQQFRKMCGWTTALLLYKPAASIVYATGFRMAGEDLGAGDELITVITGFLFLCLAVFTLQALVRFAVPLAAAVSTGRGGGGGGGGGGGAVVTTGASMVVSGFQGGGNSGGQVSGWGGGSPGPTGATGLGSSGGMGAAGAPGAAGAAAGGPIAVGAGAVSAGAQATRNLGNTATGSGGNP